MITISNIKLELNDDIENLATKIKKKLRLKNDTKIDYEILKESIDARKGKINFVYQVMVKNIDIDKVNFVDTDIKGIIAKPSEEILFGSIKLTASPVIVGFGPAGIFAALTLAKKGYKPMVFEMGESVDERTKTVESFWDKGILNENSNVQYGEGGAGTFSDGKLTTRIKDPRVKIVLETLREFGGPEDIVYSHKAHIGTDILKKVVKNIRNEIIRLGGSVNFNSKVETINFGENGKVKSLVVNGQTYITQTIILAVGNSAREIYKDLFTKKVSMVSKPYAVGFRIEHPRIDIDKSQYKDNYNHPKLKSASYNLTYKAKNGKQCYTFCMCPGGKVIGASSHKEQLVVNGMSYHNRDEENSNSAILCTVNESDYGNNVLSGLEFQESIEKKAYELGGGNYIAPVQKVIDFCLNKETITLGSVKPSYKPGYKLSNLNNIYSKEITIALKESLQDYSKKISAFKMEDAVLTGVETRSSAPVRIIRNEKLMAENNFGLFPSGEGAGYSGGIISSAVDGIKCAQALLQEFCV